MSTPAYFAASRIDVPGGTVTWRPSIVRVMSAMLRHRRHEEMLLLLDQRLEVPAELLDARRDRRGARITQHADRLAGHVLADIQEGIQVFRRPVAGDDPLENLRRPRGAFAALGALR